MIYVCGYNFRVPGDAVVVNTTSRSTNWTKGLSPFILQAGYLYGDYHAKSVENAWQYSKVYPEHLNQDGSINLEAYYKWATNGWKNSYAERYPMGKGNKALFSYWDGQIMDYITARKNIYYPLYARALEASETFEGLLELARLCKEVGKDIYLVDFDGYNHVQEGLTFEEVFDNPNRKAGHAFVVWDVLDKKYNLCK